MDIAQKNKLLFVLGATVLAQSAFILTGFLSSGNQSPIASSESVAIRRERRQIAGESGVDHARTRAMMSPEDQQVVAPEVAPPPPAEETKSVEPPPQVEVPATAILHVVKSGDTLTKIWTLHGGTYAGGVKAAAAFKEAGVSLGSLRAGEKIELSTSDSTGDIVGLRKRLAAGRYLVLTGSSADGYRGEIEEAPVVSKEKTVTGMISSSFALAAAEQGIPFQVVDELVDLFGSRVEFSRDIRVGDSFAVSYEERFTGEGEVLGVGAIKAASIMVGGRLNAAVLHVGTDGVERYFDEEGAPLGDFFLRYPVQFSRISSVFSDSRLHPVLGRLRAHNGVDFAAPIGTPVRSVADGKVVSAGYQGFSGNLVKIRHTDKYTTAYLHLSKITSGIKVGTVVKRGQLIGSVGKTGLATGPHLHYSLYINGKYADPLKTKLPSMPVRTEDMIEPEYLEATLRLHTEAHQTVASIGHGDRRA